MSSSSSAASASSSASSSAREEGQASSASALLAELNREREARRQRAAVGAGAAAVPASASTTADAPSAKRPRPLDSQDVVDLTSHDDDDADDAQDANDAKKQEEPPPLFYLNPISTLDTPPQEAKYVMSWHDLAHPRGVRAKPVEVWVATFDSTPETLLSVLAGYEGVPTHVFHTGYYSSGAEGQEARAQLSSALRARLTHPRTRVHFPRPSCPFGSFHAKFLVLFYGDLGVRVAVTTANLERNSLAFMCQAAYVQDFPPCAAAGAEAFGGPESDFGPYFSAFLESLGAGEGFSPRAALGRYDFSSADAALIASAPVQLSGGFLRGRDRLKQLVGKYLAQEERAVHVAVQGSSIASQGRSQSTTWIESDFARFAFRPPRSAGVASVGVVWPSQSDVQRAVFPDAAGSVYADERQLKRLAGVLCVWGRPARGLETRTQALPHMKSYVVWADGDGGEVLGVVVGSHNPSQAAWGKPHPGNVSEIVSWELSVGFFGGVWREGRRRRWDLGSRAWREWEARKVGVVGGVVGGRGVMLAPVPYALPLRRFDFGRGERPWRG